MKILVTGANGFVGKNLCAQLTNIKEGKTRCYGDLTIEEVSTQRLSLSSNPQLLPSFKNKKIERNGQYNRFQKTL